jgi:hypothetical protein
MITKMFVTLGKAKPVTENIRGLNLAAGAGIAQSV